MNLGDDCHCFQACVSSAEKNDLAATTFKLSDNKGIIRIFQGNHSKELLLVCELLQKALKFAQNKHQAKYLHKSMDYFRTGNVADQKEGSVALVNDKSPPAETVIGFIEPYRDPSGIRREWMGLVAVRDEEHSKSFDTLAHHAEELIEEMPWTKFKDFSTNKKFGPFENAVFVRPDFVSLESLSTPNLNLHYRRH